MSQAPANTARPYLTIEPPRGWVPLNLRELWAYREMVYRMVQRDIKSRYKQSALGPTWVILMPLISAGVFSIVFGGLAGLEAGKGANGEQIPYPLFVYCGTLIWNTFTRSFGATSSCLRGQAGIMTKVYFPRLIAPITGIAGGLLDLIFGFIVLALMMIVTGTRPTLAILTLPLFLLAAWMVSLAWGLWIATLSIRFRDLGYATGFLITILMWLTPVVWSGQLLFDDGKVAEQAQTLVADAESGEVVEGSKLVEGGEVIESSKVIEGGEVAEDSKAVERGEAAKGGKIPEQWRKVAVVAFQLNPLYHVVEGFRWAVLGYSEWHAGIYTLISFGLTFAFFVAGLYNFRRVDANVVDYI